MIHAISPLDGRYAPLLTDLNLYFSEAALIRARIAVEVEWLIYLCNVVKLDGAQVLSESHLASLRKLYIQFNEEFAKEVKDLEKETNHDVKAVEYFLRNALRALGRDDLIPFIHFACTSEDINNLAHAQILKAGVQKILQPLLQTLLEDMKSFAALHASVPMMARTHGQAASPTTVGKEFKNIGARVLRQMDLMQKVDFMGKMNGATGNYNAHFIAYPELNWPEISKKFVESLGLTWQKYTTQIEPHDYMAELFDLMRRINVILLDMDRDIWMYISYGIFKQKQKDSEVGSSTMPHKINPIDFENSEGNFGMANALLGHFSEKLPLSRMQRDLSDSTVLRNIGVAFAYSVLGVKSLIKGLSKLEINEEILKKELNENWSLLAEPIQMVMRRYGYADAYEQLKTLTRGKSLDQKTLVDFIANLDIPDEAKNRLQELSPYTYIGLADKL